MFYTYASEHHVCLACRVSFRPLRPTHALARRSTPFGICISETAAAEAPPSATASLPSGILIDLPKVESIPHAESRQPPAARASEYSRCNPPSTRSEGRRVTDLLAVDPAPVAACTLLSCDATTREARTPAAACSRCALDPTTGFSRAIRRISSRSSFGIGGRPARDAHAERARSPPCASRSAFLALRHPAQTAAEQLGIDASLGLPHRLASALRHAPNTGPAGDAFRTPRPATAPTNLPMLLGSGTDSTTFARFMPT